MFSIYDYSGPNYYFLLLILLLSFNILLDHLHRLPNRLLNSIRQTSKTSTHTANTSIVVTPHVLQLIGYDIAENLQTYLLNITHSCYSSGQLLWHRHLWQLTANLLWQNIFQLGRLQLVVHLLPLLAVAPDAKVIGGVDCQATEPDLG